MNADTLNARTLQAEELRRDAFKIHGSGSLGAAYLIGALSALVADDVWAAAVAQAEIALAADHERKVAGR